MVQQTLNSLTTYEKLEDVLRDVMQDKRRDPFGVVYVIPADENISKKWGENDWCISTYPCTTNIPVIGTSEDNYYILDDIDKYISLVSDEENYIAGLKEKICKEYGVDANIGWEIIAINTKITDEIILAITSENKDKVKSLVDEYNLNAKVNGYPTMTFDEKHMILTGTHKGKDVVGFFKRRKIKNQNKEQEALLSDLINRISDIENAED